MLRYLALAVIGLVILFVFLPEFLSRAADLWSAHPLELVSAVALTLLAVGLQALVIYWLDRHEREPVLLLLGCFIWGAVVATVGSAVLEESLDSYMLARSMEPLERMRMMLQVGAPVIEETMKGLALLLVFLLFRREFDNVLDGLVYGAMVGLGFAWIEDISYLSQAAAFGGAPGLLGLFWVRCLVHGAGHSAYTALTGCGFGLARVMKRPRLRWVMIPVFLLLGMLGHHLWNAHVLAFVDFEDSHARFLFLSAPLAALALMGPFLVLLGVITVLCWRQERRVLARYLSDEFEAAAADGGAADPVRKPTYPKHVFTWTFRHWWHRHRLRQELATLAFLKWHLERDPRVDWPPEEDAEVHELRARVRKRRGRLARYGAS
ncbi:MAG: PrsW family intramembrane metalloprotease [Planctomycetota bacterium]